MLVILGHCFRGLLGISYKADRVTNTEVRNMIEQAIGHFEDLLTITDEKENIQMGWARVKRWRTCRYHMQGLVPGKSERVRRKGSWDDNVRK